MSESRDVFARVARLPRWQGQVTPAPMLLLAWGRQGQAAFAVSPEQLLGHLGAGAPAGTFLRSDGTWAVPPAGQALPEDGLPGSVLVKTGTGAAWMPTPWLTLIETLHANLVGRFDFLFDEGFA